MDPKFQSSFIPKGSNSMAGANIGSVGNVVRHSSGGGLFSFIATLIFSISVLAALGVFGYNYYLDYRIGQMKNDLSLAQSTLEPERIKEIIRLNSRLIFTKELLAGHLVTTPLFDYLSESTPITVRFKEFSLTSSERGLVLRLAGEARGYGALALQADIFNKNEYFQGQLFSDFELNDRGDVIFSFNTIVDPRMLYFENTIAQEVSEPASTSPDSTVSITPTPAPFGASN